MTSTEILKRPAAALVVALFLTGCNYWGGDPMTPIRVTLTWSEPIDLDLLIDEQPAHRQGGGPDNQNGGTETFEIPRGLGRYTVAVQNLSGHSNAAPVLTIEGARDTETMLLDSVARNPLALSAAVLPNARKDCWVACEINAERGTIAEIGTWE